MLMSSVASLILILGLMHPVSTSYSALPEDLEGSGYDLGGSGSGDWSTQGDTSKDDKIFASNGGGGNHNTFQSSSVLSSGDNNDNWPATDSGSGFVALAKSKKFLERKEVFAALIAGGVIGVLLATSLAVILIYKWKKDDGGYILGQQRDEDYHKPSREVVVV